MKSLGGKSRWQVGCTEEPGKLPALQTGSCWEGREAGPPGTAAGWSEGERERREGRLRDNKLISGP